MWPSASGEGKRSKRLGSDDPINCESMPTLKVADRGAAHGPIVAVHVHVEGTLDRLHPPPVQNASALGRSSEERAAGLRPDDAVDLEMLRALKGTHRGARLWPEDPVQRDAKGLLNVRHSLATAADAQELNVLMDEAARSCPAVGTARAR